MADLTIVFEDGTRADVDIKPADLIAFERKYDLEWEDAKQHPKIEHSFFMAWNFLRRNRKDGANEFPSFDDWLDTVADMESDDAPKAATKRATAKKKR